MPMPKEFQNRLFRILPDIISYFGTPFHIYDERGIRDTAIHLKNVFRSLVFREFFAVKALPNPEIMKIFRDEGFGFDCSSIPELKLARNIGARPRDIMFTSNNTSLKEFEAAESDGGCILNLDDILLIHKVPDFPRLICFRYNPGERRSGNAIIGNPKEAKYGVTHDQIAQAYKLAIARGAERFGLHTMICSNELDWHYMAETVKMLLEIIASLSSQLGIQFEFINMGGGLGIPYKPTDLPFALDKLAQEVTRMFHHFRKTHGWVPSLLMESGRYMTGPHGVLVTKVINRKETYRTYVGVDACMSALMRPALYGAHHAIIVFEGRSRPHETVDVVGSLCENNDKFAVQREMPKTAVGDILVICNTGAHGHAMGFNYNGRLRPQELLLCADGTVRLIRRAETNADYFATLNFNSKILKTR